MSRYIPALIVNLWRLCFFVGCASDSHDKRTEIISLSVRQNGDQRISASLFWLRHERALLAVRIFPVASVSFLWRTLRFANRKRAAA